MVIELSGVQFDRKSHDLEYNSWLIGTSDFESSQNCTSHSASAIWEFSKSRVPIIHELYKKVVWFFIYSTFNKITSFPWKLNRYSYGVQFEINCTVLDQSKLSNFVECTIRSEIIRVIWNHKYDFRPRLHDSKFNYHFIRSILKSRNFMALNFRFWGNVPS